MRCRKRVWRNLIDDGWKLNIQDISEILELVDDEEG